MALHIERRKGQRVFVRTATGELLTITVTRMEDGKTHLAFDADESISILREELVGRGTMVATSADEWPVVPMEEGDKD